MVGWRRVLAVLGVAGAGVLLAGCDTSGSVEVVSDDEISVDLTFTDVDPVGCTQIENSTMHLSAVASNDSSGRSTCRVQGAVELTALTGVRVTEVGDYAVLSGTLGEQGTEPGSVDLTVVMPGTVVASSHGTTSRDSVHFVGPLASLLGDSFVVVSSRRQDPPWPLVGLIGLAGGVAGALLWLRVRQWMQRSRVSPPLEVGEPGRGPATAGDPGPAAGPGSAGDPALAPAAEPSAEPGPLGVDHSWFAAPPEPPDAVLEPPPDADDPPDHSMWAPPEER